MTVTWAPWFTRCARRRSPLGDLARDWIRPPIRTDPIESGSGLPSYLIRHNACSQCLETAKRACQSYRVYGRGHGGTSV